MVELSAPVRGLLQRWMDSQTDDTGDDQLVNCRLLQEAWDEISVVASADEVERIRAWAKAQLAEIGLDGDLEPLGVGRHPTPFDPADD